MIDLHTHTIYSDGELIPSELVRRALVAGYKAIALTDHMDESNIDFIVPRVAHIAEKLNSLLPITVIPGTEITHVPPQNIPQLVKDARKLGAKLVIVHGETIVEPVEQGTNFSAIDAGADVLAHPGLITSEELQYAKEKGVYLEISSRKGHSLSNGYVAQMSMKRNVPIIINTDSHAPSDLITRKFAENVLLSAGIDKDKMEEVFLNSENLVKRAMK